MLNPLAQELNNALAGTAAQDVLSDLGSRIFFPKGIIAQSAEAKKVGNTANATIGTALIGGKPIILEAVQKFAPELTAGQLVSYAPTAGNPELRELWKQKLFVKNPGLKGKNFSLPVVVPGLTAGISYLSDLFVDENHPLLAANPSWDNYALIVETRRGAELHQFNMFKDGKFDIESFKAALADEGKKYGSVRVILNFPQNPSGYSPTNEEAKKIIAAVKAEDGKRHESYRLG
ncbi:aminotransferase class I/II-fold pyridoxal phosphate-dependent enzyme [Treponema zioleckii]|uniref:aminotransferase class I/II-fold pyridoxal phosphate-dependent enzyme n=1 Tax=Treponema zioleckii TaxID=331680 RepID=UPI0030EF988B